MDFRVKNIIQQLQQIAVENMLMLLIEVSNRMFLYNKQMLEARYENGIRG